LTTKQPSKQNVVVWGVRLSRLGLVGVIAGALLFGSAAAAPEAAEAQSATPPVVRGVSILGRAFNPPTYRVPANSPIRWLNGDRVAHSVTTVGEVPVSFSFSLAARSAARTPCLDPITGAVSCPTFTSPPLPPGRYSFVCTIHRRMTGTVIVAEERGATAPTPRPTAAPPPSTAPQVRRAVSILGRSLSPRVVRVPQGGQLWFANGSSEQHWLTTVSAEGMVIDSANPPPSFDTGPIAPRPGGTADPASFSRSAPITIGANTRPGRYPYVCLIHPTMAGLIQVESVEPSA
jgi:plastocyanin